MRKLLFTLLLASVAASPALAQDSQQSRDQARAERQQARSDRQQSRETRQESAPARTARVDGSERPAAQGYAPRSSGFTRPSAPAYTPRSADTGASVRPDRRQPIQPGSIRQQMQERRDLRQANRVPPVMSPRVPVSTVPRPGTQPPAPVQQRYNPAPQWNTSWRNNSRYDWRDYRNRNRSRFHLGFYYDPFGWGYQRYSIGWRMWPSYFSSNFWIDDPWQYRLPYAPPGTRWVRYYDDAMLIDTWSGQVVDVLYNFFW
ncbi:MAG: RcnB family protein [Sphingomicrobium sp.]